MNSELILEQFRREAPASPYITGEYLQQLCRGHRKQIPCPKLPLKMNRHVWELLLERDGWQIFRQKQSNLIVVRDPKHRCRAAGQRKQLLAPILYHIHAREKTEDFRTQGRLDYAIVLCGGGGRGAFQIGVWKRLRELGVDGRFTGISGASVGALNALLFAMGDYERAESIWLDMRQGDLTRPNPDLVKSLGGALGAAALAKAVLPAAGVAKLLSRKNMGVFSKEKIERVVSQNISLDALRDKLVFASVAALSVPSPKHIGSWRLFLRPEYVYLDTSSQDSLRRNVKKVMASATVPFAFPPEGMDGKYYFDGGTLDNAPAYPLVKAGFRNILVVHLGREKEGKEEKFLRKLRKQFPGGELDGVNIRHIWSRRKLKHFLLLDPGLTRMRMQAGYEAACEQLDEGFFT